MGPLTSIVKAGNIKYNLSMAKYFQLFLFTTLLGCSSPGLYLGKEEGSIYKTSELRRSPSDKKNVRIQGTIFKSLKNDFYLIQDSFGLLLVKMNPSLLGEDTSYNRDTIFLISGETETETSHFHIKVEEIKRVK